MLGVKVTVLRYVSDDPQPGIVEFQLEDANGNRWLFVDKTSCISGPSLDADATYPQPGLIACEIVPPGNAKFGIIHISTERPFFVESVDGSTEFDVAIETLVEFN